ncbi:kinase-like domain-containing protein [Mycena maculata]|uniref:Kinase-like domain-containing protein n=1 Tax=Mycena maculata TaxID=230809 RepID=A0AAD7HU71_9AGAR|nr:kinase-like domain-containing protein [Mycena maculata]
MSTPNVVIAIVYSPVARKNLSQLASNLRLTSNEEYREALRKDERRLLANIIVVLESDTLTRDALQLTGDGAQHFLDVLQNELRRDLPQEHCSGIRRIIRKLSETCNKLPASIFIQGVTDCDPRPITGGGYADVYRALYERQPVALKRLRDYIQGVDARTIRLKFCREALVWQNLRNPYILPLIGIDGETFSPSLCMVSPWMVNGTILAYLHRNRTQSVNVNDLLWQVAQGLQYLHSHNVVHGDLRGENILIDSDWTVRLSDFGLSLFSDLSGRPTKESGSAPWMAPELINPEQFDRPFLRTPESDVYAFGCVCVELYTGQRPFPTSKSEAAVVVKVLHGIRPERPSSMNEELWQHLNVYWAHDPDSRPSADTVVRNMARAIGRV